MGMCRVAHWAWGWLAWFRVYCRCDVPTITMSVSAPVMQETLGGDRQKSQEWAITLAGDDKKPPSLPPPQNYDHNHHCHTPAADPPSLAWGAEGRFSWWCWCWWVRWWQCEECSHYCPVWVGEGDGGTDGETGVAATGWIELMRPRTLSQLA